MLITEDYPFLKEHPSMGDILSYLVVVRNLVIFHIQSASPQAKCQNSHMSQFEVKFTVVEALQKLDCIKFYYTF